MSTLNVTNIKSLAANTVPTILDKNETECGWFVRAYVNMDTSAGNISIRESGGFSSITYSAAGNYALTFTNAMPDVGYCALGNAQVNGYASATPGFGNCSNGVNTASTLYVEQRRYDNVNTNSNYVEIIVIR